jgi:pantoate--beta-alanine ligase
MEIIEKKLSISTKIEILKDKGLKVGFVPTMGALHQGHISLIQKSKKENDITVCSIFVNPTQFNNKEDLKKYPRTLERDLLLLEKEESDIVFNPDENEMYPEEDNRIFDFEGLDLVMEGKFRKGHFNGVAQIVSKFFEIIKPDKAYFGLKDFQQLSIINLLSEKYLKHLNIEIIKCEIIREFDGLAMSSRNVRLNPSQRKSSVLISQTLFDARNNADKKNIFQLKELVINTINRDANLIVEYFEIVDCKTLKSISDWNESDERRACIAVNVGDVRLIDNIKI